MKKYIKNLFLMIVVIGFFVVGKNVYAFDVDQQVSVQGFNYASQLYWLPTTTPFEMPSGWVPIQRNYIYGNFMYPRTGTVPNEYSYVRAIQGSFYSDYAPNKNYGIEVVVYHGRNFYAGQYGQGKIYDPYCGLDVSQGSIINMSCDIEQNTYIGTGIYFDRIRYHFKTSNNTYSNVLWTFQFGQITNNGYIMINLLPSNESEDNYFGWDNVYMGYDTSSDTDIGGIISSLDRNNSTIQQGNTILSQIRQKLYDFKDSFDSKMDTLISNVQSILQNMGQGISGLVQDIKNGVNGILQFISNNVLGLDDIDDTLQDFVDSIDDNGIMGDIHDFLLLPIEYLNYIRSTNNYCTDISFTIWNKEIIIPSGCFFWNRQDVGQFKTLWNTLFGGAIIFSLGFKYFKVLHNALDPTKDDLGGLDI